MRQRLKPTHILLALSTAAMAFAGCLADDEGPRGAAGTPSFPNPQPASVTSLDLVGQLHDETETPFPSAGGIWAYGDYVFGSGLGAGFFVADVSHPDHPVLLWSTPEDSVTAFARDADVVAHPDGRLTLVLATQNDGMHLYDVTDPAHPVFMARAVYEDASGEPIPNHNIAVVPGTELVFNSRSRGAGSTNDLVDVSDPGRPVVLGTYGTHGCHDITFFGNTSSDRFRAYCAGIDRTEIWDLHGLDADAPDFGIGLAGIIDPADFPLLVPGNAVLNTVGYPVRTLHHLAMVNEGGDILVIGDEHNGGGSPGMCLAYDEATGLSTPLGALTFFDISDESSPEMLGWISPPAEMILPPPVDPTDTDPGNPLGLYGTLPSCTAHFGTLVPGEEKLVMSWYRAGILLIDFSDPTAPVILDQAKPEGVATWDARVHHGYVFTGDMRRGVDSFQLV